MNYQNIILPCTHSQFSPLQIEKICEKLNSSIDRQLNIKTTITTTTTATKTIVLLHIVCHSCSKEAIKLLPAILMLAGLFYISRGFTNRKGVSFLFSIHCVLHDHMLIVRFNSLVVYNHWTGLSDQNTGLCYFLFKLTL